MNIVLVVFLGMLVCLCFLLTLPRCTMKEQMVRRSVMLQN